MIVSELRYSLARSEALWFYWNINVSFLHITDYQCDIPTSDVTVSDTTVDNSSLYDVMEVMLYKVRYEHGTLLKLYY